MVWYVNSNVSFLLFTSVSCFVFSLFVFFAAAAEAITDLYIHINSVFWIELVEVLMQKLNL